VPALASEIGLSIETRDIHPGEEGVFIIAVAEGSAAERGGLTPGAYITEINSIPISNVDDFLLEFRKYRSGTLIPLTITTNDGTETLAILPLETPDLAHSDRGLIGFVFDFFEDPSGVLVTRHSHDDTPGRRAGLKVGDLIVAIDGVPLKHEHEMLFRVWNNPGQEVVLDIVRYTVHEIDLSNEELSQVSIEPLKLWETPSGLQEVISYIPGCFAAEARDVESLNCYQFPSPRSIVSSSLESLPATAVGAMAVVVANHDVSTRKDVTLYYVEDEGSPEKLSISVTPMKATELE